LAEEVAAPASGIRTLMGEIDIETILKVDGVDVMAAMSSEVSARIAGDESLAEELSTEVSYLIANTDLGSIDSFAEVVADLSSEVTRAESVEASIVTGSNTAFSTTLDIIVNTYYLNGFEGVIDGVNVDFVQEYVVPRIVFLNGLMQTQGDDYTMDIVGDVATVTFLNAPIVGDKLNAFVVDMSYTAPQLS
jgi:hypothetical protein